MKASLSSVLLLAFLSSPLFADGSLDYNVVNKVLKQFVSSTVDGMDCVPHYMKLKESAKSVDIARGDFRLANDKGDVMRLKLEELAKVPEAERTDLDKKMINDGFVYRLWIPKDLAKFLPGELRHSLPKQSLEMVPGSGVIQKSAKFKLGNG